MPNRRVLTVAGAWIVLASPAPAQAPKWLPSQQPQQVVEEDAPGFWDRVCGWFKLPRFDLKLERDDWAEQLRTRKKRTR